MEEGHAQENIDMDPSVSENLQMAEVFIREARISLKRCDDQIQNFASHRPPSNIVRSNSTLPNKRAKSTPAKKRKPKKGGNTTGCHRKAPIKPVTILRKNEMELGKTLEYVIKPNSEAGPTSGKTSENLLETVKNSETESPLGKVIAPFAIAKNSEAESGLKPESVIEPVNIVNSSETESTLRKTPDQVIAPLATVNYSETESMLGKTPETVITPDAIMNDSETESTLRKTPESFIAPFTIIKNSEPELTLVETPESFLAPVTIAKDSETESTLDIPLTTHQDVVQMEESIQNHEQIIVERTNPLLADILQRVLTEEEKAEFDEACAFEYPLTETSTSLSLHTENSSSNLNDQRINLISFLEPKPEYSTGSNANDNTQVTTTNRNENQNIQLVNTSGAIANGSVQDIVGFACPECNAVCRSKPSLRDHMRGHKKRFKCPLCDKQFRRKTDLLDHCNNHSGEKPYTCPGCLETFSTKYRLKSHVVKHHKELQQYTCTICEKPFTILQYQIHIKSHVRRCETCCETHLSHGIHQSICRLYVAPPADDPPVENTTSKPAAVEDILPEAILPDKPQIIKSETLHTCLICGQSFDDKMQLDSHTELHMNGSQLTCDLCGESFNNESELCSHTCVALHADPSLNADTVDLNMDPDGLHLDPVGLSADPVSLHVDPVCNIENHEWDSMIVPHVVELKCQMCNEEFLEEDELHAHVCTSPDIKQLHCLESLSTGCEVLTGDELGMQTMSNNICFNCQRCNHTFDTYIKLYSHVCISSEDDYDMKFSSAISVTPQVISEADGVPFNCHVCNVTISSTTELSSHVCIPLETSSPSPPPPPPTTTIKMENDIKDTSSISEPELETTKPQLKCTKCEVSFLTELQLKCHICISTYKSCKIEMDDSPNQSKFKCHMCKSSYDTEKEFYTHVCIDPSKPSSNDTLLDQSDSNNTSRSNDCSMCDEMFYTVNDYSSHMSTHLEGTGLLCTVCSKSFLTKLQLTQHILLHYYGDQYTCCVCNKEFSSKSDYTAHLKGHETVKFPKCTICQETFLTQLHCDCHMILHSVGVHFMCPVCSSTFAHENDFNRHVSLHPKSNEFSCGACSISFHTESELAIHMLSKCDTNFECKICDKTFTTKAQFSQHRTTHLAYKCSVCSELIDTREQLGVHARTHYAPTVMCRFCKKTFPNNAELKSHIATHKFKCKLCKQVFPTVTERNCHLKTHKEPVQTVPSFPCQVCQKRFTVENQLLCHVAKLHAYSVPEYKCQPCNMTFLIENDYTSHMSMHKGSAARFMCKICKVKFNSERQRDCHECVFPYPSPTTGDPPTNPKVPRGLFSCRFCLKFFCTFSLVRAHLSEHSENAQHKKGKPKPGIKFGCTTCKKLFSTSYLLSRHCRAWSQCARSFSCKSCSKKFNSFLDLRNHLKTHRKKPMCRYCEAQFDTKLEVQRHIKSVHIQHAPPPPPCPIPPDPSPSSNYPCVTCGDQFTSEFLRDQHVMTRHNVQFTCDKCNKAFDSRTELEKHDAATHSKPTILYRRVSVLSTIKNADGKANYVKMKK